MQYLAPNTLNEATQLLQQNNNNTHILNGGTDLLVKLRTGFIEPQTIIDIKNIPELNSITENNDGFRIGASVTCSQLQEHKKFSTTWPGILEGANLIGSTQVQGRATIAGNLCNASPAADSIPAMISAQAIAEIISNKGTRTAKVSEIVTAPSKTSLKNDEIITAFILPKRPKNSADAYLRFIPRTEMDIAVVGAATNIILDNNNNISQAYITLGAVAPTFVEIPTNDIIGKTINNETLEIIENIAQKYAKPITDKRGTKDFRIKVSGVLAKRTAQIAFNRAKG